MYKLTERCLGKGADASVYLATDTKTKKQLVCKVVDLKQLEAEGKTGLARAARLIQETDILRQLHHVRLPGYW
jgi:calcium/calmodulin-dependent protein kinase I